MTTRWTRRRPGTRISSPRGLSISTSSLGLGGTSEEAKFVIVFFFQLSLEKRGKLEVNLIRDILDFLQTVSNLTQRIYFKLGNTREVFKTNC